MKIISSLIATAFLVICVCMFLIFKNGVSIRTAPIIKPSPVGADLSNISQGIFLRLFPDLQQSRYVIWNISQNSEEVQKTLSLLKSRIENEMHLKITYIFDGSKATAQEIESCTQPCWIFFQEDAVNELSKNDWLESKIAPQTGGYFIISWVPFVRNLEVSQTCIEEKRLDLECLKHVSVHEVKKYMKDSTQRYFFMRKYLDHDYFLFVEKPH